MNEENQEKRTDSKQINNCNNHHEFFDGHDAKSSYLFFLNQIPSDVVNEYYKLKQLIKHGKTLIRCIKTKDDEQRKKIDELINRASEILKDQTIKKRDVKLIGVNIAGERIPVYEITASDANRCQAETEKLEIMQHDFEKQQYSQHIGDLEAVQEEIHTFLINANIIPAIDDPLNYITGKMIKSEFNEIIKLIGEKHND